MIICFDNHNNNPCQLLATVAFCRTQSALGRRAAFGPRFAHFSSSKRRGEVWSTRKRLEIGLGFVPRLCLCLGQDSPNLLGMCVAPPYFGSKIIV